MDTVYFEHKVFSDTFRGEICSTDGIVPSECS